jgi:hypothetical protein
MHNNPGTGAATITYTVLVNGIATALAVSMLPTASTAQNTVDSVSVVAGDQITIRIEKSAAIASAIRQITVMVEFI